MAVVGGPVGWGALIDHGAVQDALVHNRRLRAVLAVGKVGSTQDVASERAAEGLEDGTVVLADHQVAGRGRRGRSWEDDPGGGTLALTVVLDVRDRDRDLARSTALTPHALGLAVVIACSSVIPAGRVLRLKWPNDVVVRVSDRTAARKVAGVLVERERLGDRDVLLCGIGLNVDVRGSMPMPDRTCLAALDGVPPSRPALLAALLRALDDTLARLTEDPAGLLERYRDRCETIGRSVEVILPDGRRIVGTVTGIDDAGRLVVEVGGRTEVVLAGTVRDHPGDEPLRP